MRHCRGMLFLKPSCIWWKYVRRPLRPKEIDGLFVSSVNAYTCTLLTDHRITG